MQLVDYGVLIAYFCALLIIGYRANKKHTNAGDYYVGGRKIGTLALMALWMSSWVGGASIMGSAEKSFSMGISFLWYPLSMFFGFILFALTFAARVKRLGDKHQHITYPDLIEQRYDTRTRVVCTVTTIFAYIGYTASQLLGAAHIITSITGLTLGMSFVVATTVTIIYTSMGGFFAVEKTDRFQAMLMMVGVTVIAVPLAINALGGVSRLSADLPPSYFELGTWGWGTIAAMFMSMVLTFFTSMDGYTRCYAAKTERNARNGTLLAAGFVMLISCSICFLGMSAKVLFPDAPGGTSALVTLIMALFPVGLKGLMLVALLSAIMSTADTCILCASANLTRDIYHRFIDPEASQKKILRLSIVSSFVVGITGALIGWYSKDIMSLLIMTFTINSAGMFIPTVGVFLWKWAPPRAAFWSMSLALVTVVGWYAGQAIAPDNALLAVDPVWPGLLVSIGTFFPLSLKGQQVASAAEVESLGG